MRDYNKEYKWERDNYKRVVIKLDKQIAQEFADKLKSEKQTAQGLIKTWIEKYTGKK